MFKYNIAGFLQWGYNFYYNQGSRDLINPYCDSTGDYFFQSGDGYSVYPGFKGEALESIRIVAFHEGVQDMRAMKLCEELYGHDFVVEEIEKVCDYCHLRNVKVYVAVNTIYKQNELKGLLDRFENEGYKGKTFNCGYSNWDSFFKWTGLAVHYNEKIDDVLQRLVNDADFKA